MIMARVSEHYLKQVEQFVSTLLIDIAYRHESQPEGEIAAPAPSIPQEPDQFMGVAGQPNQHAVLRH